MEIQKNLQVLHNIEEKADIKLLTNEARLLYTIKSEPGKSIKYYFLNSGLSYRGFYNVLNNLIEKKLVSAVLSSDDHRSKLVY